MKRTQSAKRANPSAVSAPHTAPASAGTATALARRIYDLRRQRAESFPQDLFSEPAWDMLLSLYVAECEGRLISVSSACAAAGVPQTTGLRCLGRLQAAGLALRERDRHDARRSYVRLSTQAFRKMHDLLTKAAASG